MIYTLETELNESLRPTTKPNIIFNFIDECFNKSKHFSIGIYTDEGNQITTYFPPLSNYGSEHIKRDFVTFVANQTKIKKLNTDWAIDILNTYDSTNPTIQAIIISLQRSKNDNF